MLFFPNFFYIFLLIFGCKLQKIFKFSEAYSQRKIGRCKKNQEKTYFWMIWRGSLKKKICRFIWARCHIKLNHAIYMYWFLISSCTNCHTNNNEDFCIRKHTLAETLALTHLFFCLCFKFQSFPTDLKIQEIRNSKIGF